MRRRKLGAALLLSTSKFSNVDPRLLFLAELLLAPVGVAIVLFLLLGIVHLALPKQHTPEPPSSP